MAAQPNYIEQEIFEATAAEYLFYEEKSAEKYDYLQGRVVARAGGSEKHNDIESNVIGELREKLKNKPCKPFNSNTKIWIPEKNSFFYPDAAVACGEISTQKSNGILHNPTLLVEVLSDSTSIFDKGQKFIFYRTLPSLKEYILIAQDSYFIETYFKRNEIENVWEYEVFEGLDKTLKIKSLEIAITFEDIYRYVSL
jgi:Uma2 family endonuclease